MKTINILGVKISKISKKEALSRIEEFLNLDKQHYIVTPNPEIILLAKKDEEFFYILNNASLSLPDGIGLKFAALVMGENLKRITGADITDDILKIASFKKLKVAILNRIDGLSSKNKIEKAIKKYYPDLNFKIFDIKRDEKAQNLKFLEEYKPHILFAGLGAPWQEKIIYHSLKLFPFIKLGIGVGGSFDFLSGSAKRAPYFLRLIGLEWLWRLIRQPKRLKRIFNATVIFPLMFLKWRFILPFLYRPNVACLLYKKEGDDYKILLVERKEEKGHWQIPQGGIEKKEDLWRAGMRELKEEINCDKFRPIAIFPNLWQYDFKSQKSKFGILAKNAWGYRGQRQSLFIAEFLGSDKDIKINFWEHSNWKWVNLKDFIKEAHPIRKKAYKIYLDKFVNLKNVKIK